MEWIDYSRVISEAQKYHDAGRRKIFERVNKMKFFYVLLFQNEGLKIFQRLSRN